MSEIRKIELILENCESIEIPKENLLAFDLYEYGQSINLYGKYSKCKGFIINADGYSDNGSCINSEGCMFERLQKFQDITCIKIQFMNGSMEDVYPEWPIDDETQGQMNKYQKVQFVRVGERYNAIISQDMGLITYQVASDLRFTIDQACADMEF